MFFLFLEVGFAINFPLRTAFVAPDRFWVVFSLSFVSRNVLISLLISSVTCWLFWSVLFNLPVFSCNWYLVSQRLVEKMLDMMSIFLSLLRFDLWPKMWSILENVPLHLSRRCILLHLDGMSWRYQWDSSHLMYHLILMFPVDFILPSFVLDESG